MKCISDIPESGKCTIVVATTILYSADIFIIYRKTSNEWATKQMQNSHVKTEYIVWREREHQMNLAASDDTKRP